MIYKNKLKLIYFIVFIKSISGIEISSYAKVSTSGSSTSVTNPEKSIQRSLTSDLIYPPV